MDERMTVLNARIDELKAKIAKDRAAHQYGAELYESRYANDPRYRAGMIDYILSGDRGGLDSFASTIQAHQQMEANKELMAAQKVKEEQDRRDEWQKNYQLAAADYDYAASQYADDRPNKLKEAAFNKAATNMNYWGGKLGYPAVGTELPEVEAPVSPYSGLTQGQLETLIKANLGYKDRTDEQETEFESLLGALSDQSIAEGYRSQRSKLGETVEGKKRAEAKRVKELNDAIDAAIKAGNEDKLPKGHTVRTFEDKDGTVKRFVAKKNADGNWVPVKAWGK